MTPWIVAGRPEMFDRGPGQAIAGAGRRLSEVSSELGKRKALMERQKADEAAENRRLDIAELNAKRQMLTEANRAKALGAREDAQAATMEGAVSQFDRSSQENQRQAFGGGLQEGMKSSGGVLGPFGMLNPRALAQGGKSMMESQARMAGKVELAKRMAPDTARGYLEREATNEAKVIRTHGYQRDKEALEDAVLEGRLSPDEAKPLIEDLQDSIASGREPGEIEKRIADVYDLHAKALTRAQDWEEADKTAAGMIDSLRQMAATVPDGIDPDTGVSLKQEIAKRLGQAKVEWNRTKEGPTGANQFRLKTDPQASLAGLQKILFEAQAAQDPEGFIAEDAQEARGREIGPPTTQQRIGMGIEDVPGARGRGFEKSPEDFGLRKLPGEGYGRQATQDAPGARQAAGGAASQPMAPARGLGKAKAQRDQLRAVVHNSAQEVLRGGSREERAKAIDALKERIAKELGLNPKAAEVRAAVQEALAEAFGR